METKFKVRLAGSDMVVAEFATLLEAAGFADRRKAAFGTNYDVEQVTRVYFTGTEK